MTTVLDELCPIRTFRIKNYRHDWKTDELIEKLKDRDYLYHKAKAMGDEDAWNIAKYLRNKANLHIRQSKREFILNELRDKDDNAKKFWKVIKKVLPSKQTSSQDVMLKDNGNEIDKYLVAGYINIFFINVGKVHHSPTPSALPTPDVELEQDSPLTGMRNLLFSEMSFGQLTESGVHNVVKDINISKSSGIDNISSFILKETFSILTTEITYMFNLSLQKAIFPSTFKRALVIPIPKSGNLTNVQNYRPISLLPLPGKIVEILKERDIRLS